MSGVQVRKCSGRAVSRAAPCLPAMQECLHTLPLAMPPLNAPPTGGSGMPLPLRGAARLAGVGAASVTTAAAARLLVLGSCQQGSHP